MAYRILIVDDSTFFRRRIKQILEDDAEFEVVGEAKNGLEAIDSVASLKPDVVTMDIEMPVMDGITAVKKIMARTPVPILMFSSLTSEGAQATLNALDAGALDFLPKKFEDIALNRKEAILLLQSRVKALCRNRKSGFSQRRASVLSGGSLSLKTRLPTEVHEQSLKASTLSKSFVRSNKHYSCLAIGASTGGPVALQKILTALPDSFPTPILIVQHMPGTFTDAFAKRLNELCQITISEAKTGDILQKGHCYLAPGGKQMIISGSESAAKITIQDSAQHSSEPYKPSVDLTFRSLANVYHGNVLAVILTGMGADGKEGCRVLRDKGSTVWAQDKNSCVVYGMPQAVTVANISQKNYDIAEMAEYIKKEMMS